MKAKPAERAFRSGSRRDRSAMIAAGVGRPEKDLRWLGLSSLPRSAGEICTSTWTRLYHSSLRHGRRVRESGFAPPFSTKMESRSTSKCRSRQTRFTTRCWRAGKGGGPNLRHDSQESIQGNRVNKSCGDEACEEVVVPSGDLAFESEAVFAGSFADQIESHVPQRCEIGGSVIGTDTAFVVAEDHVHDPSVGCFRPPNGCG